MPSHSPNLVEGLEVFCVVEAIRRWAQTGQPVETAPIRQEIGLVEVESDGPGVINIQ